MDNSVLIIGGIAVVGIACYCYYRRKHRLNRKVDEILSDLTGKVCPEKIETLAMSDVVDYFKSLKLTKGKDIPFIAKFTKNGAVSYLLATFDEETNEACNYKYVTPNSIDEELKKCIGNEKMVVLN